MPLTPFALYRILSYDIYIMDINRHKFHGNYKLSGYETGKITVNNNIYKHSVVISKDHLILDWSPQKPSEITAASIETIVNLEPEMIILGTGKTHQFIDETLFNVAYDNNIAVELMSSSKACMLYTILIQEQKNVIACIMP